MPTLRRPAVALRKKTTPGKRPYVQININEVSNTAMYGDKGARPQKTLNIKWQREVKGRRVLTRTELPGHFLIATLTSGVEAI